jgi:DNA polymerase-3 subunit beta
MRFSANLSDFNKILQKTLPAMPRKSTIPVLEHLNFSLTGNRLRVIATDQDITIMSMMNVDGMEDGNVLVPGKRLNDIVRALENKGTFEFHSNEENFEINIVTTFGQYGMKGLNPEEYLDLPELFQSEKPSLDTETSKENEPSGTKSAFFTKDEIIRLADKTYFAVSTDEFRPAMTGVLFQFRETYVNAVSTDSFRLVKAVCKSDKPKYPNELNVILPSRTIDLLRKIDSDLTMSFIENQKKITHARFDFSETILITRVIDEKFPPYEAVIPSEYKMTVKVNKSDFLSSIRRVSIFTSSISNQIKLELENNEISITGEDEDSGSKAIEKIKCDYNQEKYLIGFNFKYLEDALHNIDDVNEEVAISFTEQNRPAIIKANEDSDDLLMLIMPVRLN